MTGPWWAGLPAAEGRLDCAGRAHRLRWAAGELRALDHPDLEGEQILSALAGEGFPCLDALDVWHRYAADLRVLILTSRGPADPLNVWTPEPLRPGRPGRAGRPGYRVRSGGNYAVLSYRSPDDPDDDLTELLGLGGLLPDRLAATVIAAWTERLRGTAGTAAADAGALAAARPALHAALYGRAVLALRSWTGRPDLRVALTMIPEDQPPRLAREGDGLAAELPFGWLSGVWARGLATCLGRFCLTAAPAPAGDGWLLGSVGPDFGSPHPITLSTPPAG